MKIYVVLLVAMLTTSVYAQTYDLPPNPEPGKCYVKCFNENKKKIKWEDIDCALVNYQKLDVSLENPDQPLSKRDLKIINRKLVPYIKKGYRLQIQSHYVSNAPDSINVKISSQRAIAVGNYLVERGMNPALLFINSLGSAEAKKSEIEYRVVDVGLE
ncbi:OmpA family protein [Dokdonia ponticola]